MAGDGSADFLLAKSDVALNNERENSLENDVLFLKGKNLQVEKRYYRFAYLLI